MIEHFLQIDNHVEDIVGILPHWETHDNPTTSKTTSVDIKEDFLAKEWNSFHLHGKKLDYPHLKDFLKHECQLYLKQSLTPPYHIIIVAFCTSNHRLAIETGRLSLSLEILDYTTFAPISQLQTRHISCWNAPYTTPLEISSITI